MTTRLTVLLRMLGVALLAMLLLATPAMAQDDDDDNDDDGAPQTTQNQSDDDDDDFDDNGDDDGRDDDDDDDDRDDNGAGTSASGSDDDRFGAFIRSGSCETPGDVVEDIDQLDADDDDDDDDWQKLGGDESRPDVLFSEEEDVGQTVDELAGGEFVVTVHEGESADSPVIACGAIEGEVQDDGTLLIDLEEVDDSGFEGRAHFGPDDDDADDDDGDDDDDDGDDTDDQTEVTVGLWEVEPAGGV